MKKSSIVVSAAISFILAVSVSPANAFKGGQTDEGNPYVVHFVPNKEYIDTLLLPDGNDLRPQAYKTGWCSGAVLHPHIVITDAHCLHDKQINPQGFITRGWGVSQPGVTVGTNIDKASTIVDYFFLSMEFYNSHGCPNPPIGRTKTCSPIGDIAAVVVKDPLPVPANLKIATVEQIRSAINSRSQVVGYGYGLTERIPDNQFIEWNINKYAMKNYSTIVRNIRSGGDVPAKYGVIWPEFVLSVEHSTNQSACSGDSGGPFYLQQNGFMYYLGTNAGTNWDMCTDKNPRPAGYVSTTWISSFYYHNEVYSKALEFVNSNFKNTKEESTKLDIIKQEVSSTTVEVKRDLELEAKVKAEAITIAKTKKSHDFARKLYEGRRCGKLNSTKSLRGLKFTCIKVSNKLVWDNGVVISK